MSDNRKVWAVKIVNLAKIGGDQRKRHRNEVDCLEKLQNLQREGSSHNESEDTASIRYLGHAENKEEQKLYVILEAGDCDVEQLLEGRRKIWHKAGHTDPFVTDSNFVCWLWQDMLRAVKVLP